MISKTHTLKSLIALSFFTIFFGVLASHSAKSETRRAFVVGVSDYIPKNGISKLNAPVNDAEQIRDALRKRYIDFVVDMAVNKQVKDKETFLQAFDDFLSRVQPGDQVLFYFSGHGYHVPKKGNYFLLPTAKSQATYIRKLKPSEARALDTEDKRKAKYQSWITQVAISEEYIEKRIAEKDAGAIIIIADACRTLLKGTKGAKLDISKINLPNSTNKGTFRLYSAGPGQISLDSTYKLKPKKSDVKKKKRKKRAPRSTSLFTRVFLNELKTPGQEINILAAQVKITVREQARKTGGVQIPDFIDHPDNNKFYFWQGDFREQLEAFCATAQAEYEQLRFAVMSGSVGRGRLEEKRIQLSRCDSFGNYGDKVEEMMRMEAQGTGSLATPFVNDLDQYIQSGDPSQNCDVNGSSPLDPNRPRQIVKFEIQKVALSALTGQMSGRNAKQQILGVVKDCEAAVQARGRVARFKYNLGRALYALAKLSKGAEKVRALQGASLQFQSAADLGYAAAYNDLALLHQNSEYYNPGSPTPANEDRGKARDLFLKGAQLGHIVAQYNLGMAYINGGLNLEAANQAKWDAEAFSWLSRASERGFVPAMIETAKFLYWGRGIDRKNTNREKALKKSALELLKTAASRGSWEAMYWLGSFHRYNDPDRAIIWHSRAGEAGDTRSQVALAEMLTSGEGVPAAQLQSAGRYWRLAAEAGSMKAQMKLANLLSKGKIPFRPQLKGDPDGGALEIRHLYQSAFSRGEIRAGFTLALLYRTGFPEGNGSEAIPKDAEKAIDLLLKTIDKVKAAEPGSAQANPEFKFRSAFTIIAMYDAGEAVRSDGSQVLSEDQVENLRNEYGDGTDLLSVRVDILGRINCGSKYSSRFLIRPPRFLVWNWKNKTPPTTEQFDWWEKRYECKNNIRADERAWEKKYQRRLRRKARKGDIGITAKIRKAIDREHKFALRDAKRKGPQAKTFTQRMTELLQKRARAKRKY